MYCRYCGYKVKDKHVYCRNCGQKIVRTQQVVELKKEVQPVKEVNEVQTINEVNKVKPIENKRVQEDKRKKRNQKIMIAAIVTLSICVIGLVGYTILKPMHMNDLVKNTTVTVQEAEDYFSEGDYEKALEAYNEILEENPDNEKALEGIASVYEKKIEEYLLDEDYKNAILCAEEGYKITENNSLNNKRDEIVRGEIRNDDGELIKRIEFNEEYEILSYSEIKYDEINDLHKEFCYDGNNELLYTIESLDGSDLLRTTYYTELGDIDYSLDKDEFDTIVAELRYTKGGVLNTKIEFEGHNEEIVTLYYLFEGKEKDFQYKKNDTSVHIVYADDGSYVVYVYNEDNINIGNYVCDEKGILKSYEKFEINENDQVTEMFTYDVEGTLIDWFGFEYVLDSKQWNKQIHYLLNGDIDFYIEYEYDENGDKISETYYNADGTTYSL
jgi:tetratricopeptide (TPR) repeat protein